jgi:DNA-binding HxlR family transcriptional regulator
MKKRIKRSYCGISSSLDILGDKWSLLIVRDLMFHRKSSYGDLLNSDEKIATNILATRLSFLESIGILTRMQDQKNKKKYIYKLTQKGIDLMPVLMEIVIWSDKYLEISERGKAFAQKIKKNKAGLIKKLSENLRK